MIIAFTICSNNYLAHAKALGDSYLEFHPDSKFIIALVDKYNPDLDYGMFSNLEIIPVEALGMPEFDLILEKYNIIELNTAVKPTYIHYIFKKYKCEKLIFLDPDILVTGRLDEVIDILDTKNIVLTPHMCSPVDDDYTPTDYHTLRGGIFNLGFIALSNYEKIKDFIDWWHQRVVKYGFADLSLNMFYDQLWINYVPVFFDNYYILKHLGYNVANWNLHERNLTKDSNNRFVVNEQYSLKFFHFSSYNYANPSVICKYLNRYDFNSRPDLIEIFTLYREILIRNQVEKIRNLSVHYYPNLNSDGRGNFKSSTLNRAFSRLKKAIKVLLHG